VLIISELWDDDDFGVEFAIFTDAPYEEQLLYNEKVSVLYVRPYYESITDYINAWNKRRKRIKIDLIRLCKDTPYESDEVLEPSNTCLDMGARLFNAMKQARAKKWDYVKIIKLSGKDKFDVTYYVEQYKLQTQKKLTDTKKTKSKS